MADYTYTQSYAFGASNTGEDFTVTNQAAEVVATGTVAAGGTGSLEITVPDDSTSILTFTRDSDSVRLATVVFDPREIPALNSTDVSALALETTALAIRERTDNLPDDPAAIEDVQVTVDGGFSADDRATLAGRAAQASVDTANETLDSFVEPMGRIRDVEPAEAPASLSAAPADASTQWVEGYLLRPDGTKPHGAQGTFTAVTLDPVTGRVVYGATVEAQTNKDGYVKVGLLRGTWIVDFPETTVRDKQFVLADATVNLSAL